MGGTRFERVLTYPILKDVRLPISPPSQNPGRSHNSPVNLTYEMNRLFKCLKLYNFHHHQNHTHNQIELASSHFRIA